MKKIMIPFWALIILVLISCNRESNSQKKNESKEVSESPQRAWKKLKGGLYLHTNNDLAFATDPEIVFVPKKELEGERCPNVFLTTFGYDDTTKLKNVIDTSTFEALGACYYKDKSHIYSYYAMCDGGYFNIFSDDTASFKLLGSSYATFNSKIYHCRGGQLDADAATFQVFEAFGPIAKDKKGYFAFHERVSEEELKEDLGAEGFEKLEQLSRANN